MKKRLVSLCFLFVSLTGIYLYQETKVFPLPIKRETNISTDVHKIVRVVDGDTLVMQINDKLEKVRLLGLDTPETVDPRKPVECWGKEASDEAKRILTGRSVHLETDQSQDIYDKYGRLLAYVFLEDGTNFNKLMIKNGYGYEYTYHTPYKYQKEFKQAEKEARENKRGLWSNGICEK